MMHNDREDAILRTLTVTAVSPKTKNFTHTPIGEELFDELKTRLGLAVVAGYLRKNGTGPYEILQLYVDRERSDRRWDERLSHETWAHDAQYDEIRDVLFDVFGRHGLEPPIERSYDRQTGGLISDTCFHISLTDFAYWQEYWKSGDDR